MHFICQVYFIFYDYLLFSCYIARIDDQVPGYEQDDWMKTKKRWEAEEQLRADRWYYQNMDGERADPEQSGW